MNISVYDFSSSEQRSERVLGKIVDTVTSQQVEIKADQRYQQLMTSSSNEVHVTLYSDDVSLALEVSLLGCSSMSPPAGAWMTRDGDVMEVGCHTGSRSWTLRCENNQWVGAVGFCGGIPLAAGEQTEDTEDHDDQISTSKCTRKRVMFATQLYPVSVKSPA